MNRGFKVGKWLEGRGKGVFRDVLDIFLFRPNHHLLPPLPGLGIAVPTPSTFVLHLLLRSGVRLLIVGLGILLRLV